ncbi:MAG TPA: ammonium transporter [Acidimicrobiales bacterium]|nr:ammonium transporter [Acidimicrobiales bacterium]
MELDSGATAWVLASSALVLFMTPGLALFYGGMTRSKNVLNMLMMNVYCMGIIPVLWVLLTFSLAFGNAGDGGFIGDFDFAFAKDLYTALPGDIGSVEFFGFLTIPVVIFAAYQLTFAVITPALISGAVADRMKFSAWAIFVPLWAILVYSPVAHWVFGGGFLAVGDTFLGDVFALDFAGGAVVHMNAGAAALALVLLLGRRRGWPDSPMPPHNLTMTMLGTGILWFGWFGFNAGSALAADGIAAAAFMNTFVAAAAGMLGWLIVERLKDGHFTTLGACSGAVAGLVAITPCAGFVGGLAPVFIGLGVGVVCYFAISLKTKLGYDDSLDVVGVHLVGGLFGALALGLFADGRINPFAGELNDAGEVVQDRGLFLGGGADLLIDQIIASVVTLVFSFVMTLIIGKVIDATIGLRVTEADELTGLDQTQHAEAGYNLADHI